MIDSLGINFSNRYMFGFNGQEKDNEVSGLGNSNTAEFWQYDTRLGRRFNIDPVDQISISNYAVNRDNPILFNDPNGDYSRIGAWLRNKVNGGDGISYTESTGEWGYKRGTEGEAGIRHIDGLSPEERQGRIDKFKETHHINVSTGKWETTPTISEHIPSFFEQWSYETRWDYQLSYSILNSLYTAPQLFTSPFTGDYYSLSGELQVRGSSELTQNFTLGASFYLNAALRPAIAAARQYSNLLNAANAPSKGGLTAVGRALQKHGSRQGSLFPKATGDAASINAQGKTVLQNIVNNPNATIVTRHHARFGNVMEIKTPNGQGARFSSDGKTFYGFIE